MDKLDGYINISVRTARALAKETLEHVNAVRNSRDQVFLDWAIPYFNNKCKQKWWQIWRRPKFKDLKDFNRWFKLAHGHLIGEAQIRAPANICNEDRRDYEKVCKEFKANGQRFTYWYPSVYGFKSIDVCNNILKTFPISNTSDMFLSLDDCYWLKYRGTANG